MTTDQTQSPVKAGWLKRLFGGAKTPVAPVVEPAPIDVLGDLIAQVTSGAAFSLVPASAASAATAAIQATLTADDQGHSLLRLSGGNPKAGPGGRTDGFSIQVPDEFEAAASTHSVTVKLVARATPGADAARFALAYSTNEVGNSGWRWFEATAAWAAFETEYAVPQMKNGKGDFIGILPSPDDLPGIDVAAVVAVIAAG